MPIQRLSAEKRKAIKSMLRKGTLYFSEIARMVGVGETTVRNVRDAMTDTRHRDRFGATRFRAAKKYYCEACRAWVVVRPCPACVVREQSRR